MQLLSTKTLLLLISSSLFNVVSAQQTFSTTGGDLTGSGGTASFTMGQIDYIAVSNTTNLGIQQAFDVSTPLPANLLTFTAEKIEHSVLLKWVTNNQKKVSHYIVQHSINGTDFTTDIGTIKAKENNSNNIKYSMIDNKPVNGYNYYRLKIVDTDESFIFSNIVVVNFDEKSFSVSLYPNPTPDLLNINIGTNNIAGNHFSCELFNPNGKLLLTQKVSNNNICMSLAGYKTGIYLLKISNNNTETKTFKIIKK